MSKGEEFFLSRIPQASRLAPKWNPQVQGLAPKYSRLRLYFGACPQCALSVTALRN